MSTVTARPYANRAYLKKVTETMIAFRSDDRYAGLYDAGDLNWWWRDGDYSEPEHQMFWEDARGRVLAFGLLSAEYRSFDYEFLPSLGDAHEVVLEMFRWGLSELKKIAIGSEGAHEIFVRDSHTTLRKMAEKEGFSVSGEAIVQTMLGLTALPQLELCTGYTVRRLRDDDLIDGGTPVLHQDARALKRVQETPHYRQDLHLVVESPESRLAAECIIWLDELNHIGIFEPVRTHPDFCRRGLGKLMLYEGLKRMQADGVTLAKVGHDRDNPAAKGLYESLGFRNVFEKLSYTYEVTK